MIRINLLGVPRPKRGRSAAQSVPGAGPNPMVMVVVVVLIGLIGNGWYYLKLTHERDDLAKQTAAADAENRRLGEVKKKFDEADQQTKVFQKRANTINDLMAKKSGPVDLMNAIGDTINSTDAVWINTMKEEGNNVNLEGVALGAHAVANLIGNLKKRGCQPNDPSSCYFKTVEVKETFQDDSYKGMQAFQFVLTCEKQDKKS